MTDQKLRLSNLLAILKKRDQTPDMIARIKRVEADLAKLNSPIPTPTPTPIIPAKIEEPKPKKKKTITQTIEVDE